MPDRYYEFDQPNAREQADHDADRGWYARSNILEHEAQAFAAGMGNKRAGEGGEKSDEERA